MAQLTVRNLDDDTVAALKARAAENGRSAEAEHRQILRGALRKGTAPKDDFFAAAARLRARLGPVTAGGPSTTEILQADRTRSDVGQGAE